MTEPVATPKLTSAFPPLSSAVDADPVFPPRESNDAAAVWPLLAGLTFAAAWFTGAAFMLAQANDGRSFSSIPLVDWVIGFAALGAPIALMAGLIIAHLQRAREAKTLLRPLATQIEQVFEAQRNGEELMERFNAAMREQIALLRESGRAGEEEVGRLWQRLRDEKAAVQAFAETGSGHAEITDKIVQASLQFDQLIQDRLKQLEAVEDQMRQRYAGIASAADQAHNRLNVLGEAAQRVIQHQQAMGASTGAQHDALIGLFDRLAAAHQASAGATDEAIRRLESQANAVDETALRLGARLHNLGGVIRDEQNALDQAGQQITQRASITADAAAQATQQMRQLLAALQDGTEQSRQFGRDVSEQLRETVASLNDALHQLNTQSTAVARAAGETTAQIGSHAGELLSAATHIQDECSRLPVVLGEAGLRMETATAMLRGRVAEARETLETGAGYIAEAAQGQQNGLTAILHDLQQAAERTNEFLKQSGQQFSYHLDGLRSGHEVIAEEQKKFSGQMVNVLAQMSVSGENLANLRTDAAAAHEQLVAQMDACEIRAQNSNAVLSGHSAMLAQHTQALAVAAQQTEGHLANIGEKLRQAAQNLSRDFDRMIQRLAVSADSSSALVADKVEKLQSTTEDAAQLLLGFSTIFDRQMHQATEAGDAMIQLRDNLISAIGQSVTQSGNLRERMMQDCEATLGAIQRVVSQTQQFDGVMRSHAGHLIEGATQAAALVRDAGSDWQDKAQAMVQVAAQARGELHGIASGMEALLQKSMAMRATLRTQGQDLAASLAGALQRVAQTNEALGGDAAVDQAIKTVRKSL